MAYPSFLDWWLSHPPRIRRLLNSPHTQLQTISQHQARLERMVCQKEVEIALLRNFLGSDGDDSGNG